MSRKRMIDSQNGRVAAALDRCVDRRAGAGRPAGIAPRTPNRRGHFPAGARRGAILVVVLVSLFVATLLGLGLVELILMHHRQRTIAAERQQCFWLAEAGVQRAIHRLAKSADYPGETWQVSGEVLGTSRPGVVAIQVTKAAPSPSGRLIRVEARFPDDPVRRVVCQREHFVKLSTGTQTGKVAMALDRCVKNRDPAGRPSGIALLTLKSLGASP